MAFMICDFQEKIIVLLKASLLAEKHCVITLEIYFSSIIIPNLHMVELRTRCPDRVVLVVFGFLKVVFISQSLNP